MVLYEDELADSGVSLLTVKVVSLQSPFSPCGLICFSNNMTMARKAYHVHFDFLESHAKLLVSPVAILGESISLNSLTFLPSTIINVFLVDKIVLAQVLNLLTLGLTEVF